MKKLLCLFFLAIGCLTNLSWSQDHSVAREWNELNLNAIRNDLARPTVTARNLWHASAGMYDAWAAYDLISRPYFLGNSVGGFFTPFNGVDIPETEEELKAVREEAISYAAYRILSHRYNNLPGTSEDAVLESFDDFMNELGYPIDIISTDYENDGPAALGNYIAEQIIAFGLQDGSFEDDDYDNQYYESIHDNNDNDLVTNFSGNPDMLDPNRWQPLTLEVVIGQGGTLLEINTPEFLSPEWGNVIPFSLTEEDMTLYSRDENFYQVYCDPGDPAYMDAEGFENGITDDYKWNHTMVAVWSGLLDHTSGVMIDASPNGIGNVGEYPADNSIGEMEQFYNYFEGLDTSEGHDINPHTGEPYEPQMVPLGDYGRVLAEFWADGPDSETPPGHWFDILNYVSDNPLLEKRWNGQGEILDDLEWDIKSYFAMGANMHDCAIAAWSLKGWYDYVRPISAIRYMADHGQSSDSSLPSYDPEGLPLLPGYVELVYEDDPLVGVSQENLHKVKVKGWKGPDFLDQISNIPGPNFGQIADGVADSTLAGVDWILAEKWWPYQRPTFVSPPFAGYVSGHSTFSRGAAYIMESITGDAYFPGGMGIFETPQNDFLVFETGPSVDMELQWATYKDASDQCSLSRIFGGIHPPVDDIPGRKIGFKIGERVFDMITDLANPLQPRILSAEASTDLINDAYAGTTYTIEVEYNLPMDQAVEPVIVFNEDVSGTLMLATNGWTGERTYQWSFSTMDDNYTLADIQGSITGGQDLEGDVQFEYLVGGLTSIDTENPTLTTAFFESNLINESTVGENLNLLVNFSEDMSEDEPVLTWTNDDPTLSSLFLQLGQPGWLSDTQFAIAYSIVDADEELYEMTFTAEGATDLAGNDVVIENVIVSGFLDTAAPEVVSVNVNEDMINESLVGDGTFSITVEINDDFNEESPLISYPLEDPSMSVIFDPEASGITGPSEYTLVFNVEDLDLELFDIDILLEGILDDAGNSAVQYTGADLFSLDTKAPIVEIIDINDDLINEMDTNLDYTITFTFSEQMDEATSPEILFSETTPESFSFNSGSGWNTAIIYRVIYDITDEDEELELMVSAESATDLAGNVMEMWEAEDVLIIDNRAPDAIVTASTYDVTESNSGTSGFQLLVLFDESVNEDVIPEIAFPDENPGLDLIPNSDNTGWLGSAYRFDYDVASDLTPLAFIDLEISNAEDLNGNNIGTLELLDYFSIELDTFLSVNDLIIKEIKVYPNPVMKGDNVTLEMESVASKDLVLYDQSGRIIQAEFMPSSSDQVILNTAELSSGKYFIKVKEDDKHSVLRIEVLN